MVVMFNQRVHFKITCFQIRLLIKPPGGGFLLVHLRITTNDTGTGLRARHPVDPFAVTRSGDLKSIRRIWNLKGEEQGVPAQSGSATPSDHSHQRKDHQCNNNQHIRHQRHQLRRTNARPRQRRLHPCPERRLPHRW